MSSWSRLIRSSASVSTMSKRPRAESIANAWMPGRWIMLEPEMEWSEYSSTTVQPSFSAHRRHMRNWSAMDASRCRSEE